VASLLRQADRLAADKEWSAAVERYDQALALLPAGHNAEARRIRLERAKAQMLAKKLPEAHADLKALVAELEGDAKADTSMLENARHALASSQYYMTWLMRLEGLPADVWEPEVESARQNYRLLAEKAELAGNGAAAQKYREDLEATVRLARMDLSDLQGLPLPSQ